MASIEANTMSISGKAEKKQMQELFPGIINQLGMENLGRLAQQLAKKDEEKPEEKKDEEKKEEAPKEEKKEEEKKEESK